ncbi:WYL domain-containing protein [uncultured Parasphingorhabdus sp.]|uniref:WYL domain-containing protein n=1 Tax=uncultured Parasphingorhabdus sp. TaxID=2709694 RepID=UPI002AA87017|nr:WYL domain-containing protein [uncultured Parasphingorhabdus sp.]
MLEGRKNARRLEFIEFQLTWRGRVGRADLQDQFSISPQQATNDLSEYSELAPRNLRYDPRQRTYVRDERFRPRLTRGSPLDYLTQLELCAADYRNRSEIWPDPVPQFETMTTTTRPVARETLQLMLSAIETGGILEMQYVSLSSDDEEVRRIAPHALANDGHRWHARAYDLDKERHSDFVLSRLDAVAVSEGGGEAVPDDKAWNTLVTVKLQPEDGLGDRQRERLEIEYGMDDGRMDLTVRKAMLYYYLRHYGFDPRPVRGKTMRNVSSFRLAIANIQEVEKNLERRS